MRERVTCKGGGGGGVFVYGRRDRAIGGTIREQILSGPRQNIGKYRRDHVLNKIV